MTNMLHSYRTDTMGALQRMSSPKKFFLYGGVTFFVLLFFVVLWGLFRVPAAKAAVTHALEGKQNIEDAQTNIAAQKFDLAKGDLVLAQENFGIAQEQIAKFRVLKIVPGVGPQIQAADQMLIAATNLSSGLAKVAGVGEQVIDVIGAQEEDASFADISPEDKGEILKVLSESTVDLQSVRSDMELASLAIERIPEKGLIAPIQTAVAPIKEQLPLLDSLITQAIPLAESLPTILGAQQEKKYLFLLQNNNELRPTGGFIGTYGILKVKNGEIIEFGTDNIYNLDNAAKDRVTEPSPGPIAQHTSTKNWLMRNINWDPNFPATAVKAEEKYYEESEVNEDFDGVIAVTPRFIASLLALTGPITVEDTKFTSENLTEQLQIKTEFSFESDGKTDATRKEIIGTLADALIDQLFGLPKSQLPAIWKTFVQNVDEKHILLYVEDKPTQQLIVEQNWAGEIKPYTSDYIAVIDANLAALKTDAVMKRTLHYNIAKEDGEYVATAKMDYENQATKIDFFRTRYRTWTRFYLPAGIELIEAKGFMTGDKTQNGQPTEPAVSSVEVEQADGSSIEYTVVEGFISIEPRNMASLELKYRLSENLDEQIDDGEYELIVQKQAGTVAHGLNLNLDFGKGIRNLHALDMDAKIEDNRASISGDLRVDRKVNLELK